MCIFNISSKKIFLFVNLYMLTTDADAWCWLSSRRNGSGMVYKIYDARVLSQSGVNINAISTYFYISHAIIEFC